ncbi:MAG TPA: BrnA antitoxin family protein [Acetobacteraceae bacterium]|nr:BrnA antitoxin family protein [Acetobacteraceae bacterium]
MKTRKSLIRPAPEEDAEIQRGIDQDPDNPEWTAEDFARARPAREVHPELVAEYLRTRGKQKRPTKVLVSLRLERDLVERLRASGPGWQSRASDILRKTVMGA